MPDRFFVPSPFDRPIVTLAGPEARHLRTVLRLRAGNKVILFDGEGTEATAEIVEVKKWDVELRILETRQDPPESGARVVVATAVPKGERFRWLVEKCVELGVDRLVPLNTSRSVVDPRETRLEKLRTLVIAACKQSRRNRLMRIDPTASWAEFLEAHACGPSSDIGTGYIPRMMLLADPSGEPVSAIGPRFAQQGSLREIILVVGPEGGLVAEELEHARAVGAQVVSLGRRILRIETAAIVMASLISCGWTRPAG